MNEEKTAPTTSGQIPRPTRKQELESNWWEITADALFAELGKRIGACDFWYEPGAIIEQGDSSCLPLEYTFTDTPADEATAAVIAAFEPLAEICDGTLQVKSETKDAGVTVVEVQLFVPHPPAWSGVRPGHRDREPGDDRD